MTTIRVFGLLMVLVCSSGTALAEGWSWSSLNPFSKDDNASRSTRSTKSKSHKPSLLARMGAGTRSAWNNTREALTFGDDEEKPRKAGRHFSWDDPSPYRRTKKKEESSWWSNLWRSEEPHPSATVQDFLSQERPGEQ